MAQMVRDAARAKTHDALLGAAREMLDGVTATGLIAARDRAVRALDAVAGDLAAYLVDRWATGYEPLRDPAYPRRVAEVLDG